MCISYLFLRDSQCTYAEFLRSMKGIGLLGFCQQADGTGLWENIRTCIVPPCGMLEPLSLVKDMDIKLVARKYMLVTHWLLGLWTAVSRLCSSCLPITREGKIKKRFPTVEKRPSLPWEICARKEMWCLCAQHKTLSTIRTSGWLNSPSLHPWNQARAGLQSILKWKFILALSTNMSVAK